MSANQKTWQPTRHQHLYRHKSGILYVRLGRRTWKSLKTRLISVAIKKRDEALALEKIREEKGTELVAEEIRTLGEALAVRRRQIENDSALKESTRKFWGHIFDHLPEAWPGLERKRLERLTREESETWAAIYAKTVSASHFNHVLSALRTSAQIGVDAGIRQTNPFANIKQRKTSGKDLTGKLPSKEEFASLVAEIRHSPSRWASACGDLVEFLAYSGVRIGEAKWVLWRHCDLERGKMVITGEPEEGTKNREIRHIPIIPNLDTLLRDMASRRFNDTLDSRVIPVLSATKAIKRAAKVLGIEPLTHHDFRHLFATTCIESGVDIPTVSKWLGHKDGGALAMRVYGHLRNEHSLAAAKKVSFS